MEVVVEGRIGNGKMIRFWDDKWLHGGSMKDLMVDNYNIDWNLKVAAVIAEGVRDIDLLKSLVPQEVLQDIISGPIFLVLNLDDNLIWNHSTKGSFTVNFAYRFTEQWGFEKEKWNWNGIWKINVIPRIKFFLLVNGSQ